MIAIRDAWGEKRFIPNSDSPELGTTFDTRGKTMKKVLLATTALVLSAGIASAEYSLTGSAAAGIGRDNNGDGANNNGEFHVYNSGSIDIAASTETANGLTIAVSTSVSFGTSFAFDDGGFADEDGAIGAPTLTISGSGVTLTFADDGVDHLQNDDDAGDVGVSYSSDTMSVGAVLDVDGTNYDWSANGSFTTSGVTVSAAFDANEDYTLGVAYSAGAVSASLETDGDVNTLGLGYSAEGMSASIEMSDDSTWSVEAGYSANGMGITVATDDASAWSATASYDLGGASLDAGITSEDIAYAGMSFSF
jgi:outer membrane protein OmpU